MKNKKMLKNTVGIILIFSLFILGITNCKKKEAEVIKIGAILPLTGLVSEMGQKMAEGLNFAMEYWNTTFNNKKKLLVKIEDSKSNPKDGITALKFLLSQNYKFFIIPHSVMAMSAKPILINTPDVIAFLDASHPDIVNPPHPRIFRHSQNAEWEAENIVNYIFSIEKSVENIILFYMNDEYGRAFAERMNEFLKKMETQTKLFLIPYEVNTLNFKEIVFKSKIRTTPNAVVVIAGAGRPMGLLIKALREQRYKENIFAAMGYVATGVRNLLSEEERKNIYYTDLDWQKSEALVWLENKYFSLYKINPPGVTKLEFLSALLLASAIKEAGERDIIGITQKIKDLAPKLIGVTVSEKGDLLPKIIIKKEE